MHRCELYVEVDMKYFVKMFPSYDQQDATFLDLFISIDALHVPGGSSAHHQEHKNCTHSFRYCQPILLLVAGVDEMEFHLIHDSS